MVECKCSKCKSKGWFWHNTDYGPNGEVSKYDPGYIGRKFYFENELMAYVRSLDPTPDEWKRYIAWRSTQPLLDDAFPSNKDNEYKGKIQYHSQVFGAESPKTEYLMNKMAVLLLDFIVKGE